MSDRTRMLRVSERVHELAERMDPDGKKGRAVEFALELHAALIAATAFEVDPFGRGPQTADASNMVTAFEGQLRERLFGQAVDRAFAAYARMDPERWREYLEAVGAPVRDADASGGVGSPDGRESAE